MNTSRLHYFALLGVALFLFGCTYEAPVTEKPTAKINERLIGDWTEAGKPDAHMVVCKLNDSEYIVSYDGVFHAWHSDFEGMHFISVQNIAPLKETERKFAFVVFELQDNDKKFIIRTVNQKVIPDTLHTTAEIQEALKRNLKDPHLFNEDAGIFVRK